jgi:hypothetical protein
VLLRSGAPKFVKWGSDKDQYRLGEKAPGRYLNFPAGYHVPLEAVRSDLYWQAHEACPVKIGIAAFLVTWPFSYDPPDSCRLDPSVTLNPGQFLQGSLLRSTLYEARVYIVTVPPPAQYADIASPWPRIVGGNVRLT